MIEFLGHILLAFIMTIDVIMSIALGIVIASYIIKKYDL